MSFSEIVAALTALADLGKIGEAEIVWMHQFADSVKAKALAHDKALETAPPPQGPAKQPEE